MAALRRLLLPALAYLVLAVALTWPVALDPVGQVVGHAEASASCHVWVIWWAQQHLSDPLSTLIFYPSGANVVQLYGSDLLSPLLLGALPWPPALLYNLWVMLLLALAAGGAHWLARSQGAGKGAWVAGVLFASAPFFQHELLNGTSELLAAAALPWLLGLLLRTLAAPSWRSGALLGVVAGWAVMASVYNAFFVLAILVVVGLWRLSCLGPVFTPKLGLAATSAALTGALVLSPWALIQWAHAGRETLSRRAMWRSVGQALPDSFASFGDWLDPRAVELPVMLPLPGGGELPYWTAATVTLSFVGLALTFYTLSRKDGQGPWLLLIVVGVVLAAGPYLRVGGQVLTLQGHALPLPDRTLALLFPPFELTALHAYRYAVLVLLGLSVLAAKATPRGWPALLVLGEALLLSPLPWPAQTTAMPDSAVLRSLSRVPEGAVLHLPVRHDDLGDLGQALLAQAVHGHPIQDGGVHDRAGARATQWVRASPLLSALDERPMRTDGVGRHELSQLMTLGFAYLLVPVDEVQVSDWAQITLGEPWLEDGEFRVWTLPQE